jgi:hypothetical protein
VEKRADFGQIKSSFLADWAIGWRQIDPDFGVLDQFHHRMDRDYAISSAEEQGRPCGQKTKTGHKIADDDDLHVGDCFDSSRRADLLRHVSADRSLD